MPNGITLDTRREKAYVVSGFADTTYSHGGVSVIDMKNNVELGVIPLPKGDYGISIACDPYSNLIYVGAQSWNANSRGLIHIIDGSTYQIISTIQTNGAPWWVVLDTKKNNIYTGNQLNSTNTVDIISGNTIIKTILIPTGIQGMAVLNP